MIVKLNIKNKILFNYLDYLFIRNPDGTHHVTMKNDFWRLLVALVRRSPTEVPVRNDGFTARLKLPKNICSQNAEFYHLYFTEQDAARLNVLLDTIFNLDLNAYYLKGSKRNIQKREIIEAFIVSRKLFAEDFAETLGKRIYREQLKDFERLVSSLYNKARYNNDRIEGPEKPSE